MKPGNRHENEMVPSHTKRQLWKMRERFSYVYTFALLLSHAQKGFYFGVGVFVE